MSRSLSTAVGPSVTPISASAVNAGDEVRHFDQLTTAAQRVVTAARKGRNPPVRAPSLDAVDVVVFTDYYRID